MSTRADIAAAASLPGVSKVSEYYRQSLKPGDGFVRLAQRERASNGFGYINKWEVWLTIPADFVAAEKWLDQNLNALTDAINSVMVVTSVTPSELVLGASTVNGVIFAGSLGV